MVVGGRGARAEGEMMCGHDDFFYITRAAKIGRAAQPKEPCDNTGPTRAFVGLWGKGGMGGGGVLSGLESRGRGDDGKAMEMGFFYASCVPVCTSLRQKKPKAKIMQCSGMSKFCPPAAASRKSMRWNCYEWTQCAANGGMGGEGGTQQNWQGSAPQQTSLTQTWFLVFGLLFESAGSSLKKKEADSKTATMVWIKIRINPI
jgi:hypothetical protein